MKFLTIVAVLGWFPANGQEPPRFTTEANLVPIEVQVLDQKTGQAITGLAREDFIVLDEGFPREIGFFDGSPASLNLVLLLDLSGWSINEGVMFTTDALLSLLEPGDQVAIVAFANGDAQVRLWLTSDAAGIREARRKLFGGWRWRMTEYSRLFDAIRTTANRLTEAPRERRPVIVAITHNRDKSTAARREEAVRALMDGGITLEALTIPQEIVVQQGRTPQIAVPGMSTRRSRAPVPSQFLEDLHVVEPIVEATGGLTIPLDYPNARRAASPEKTGRGWNTSNLARLLDEALVQRLRAQYTLAIYSERAPRRTFHRLEVKLTGEALARHPNASVHARAGYYTVAEDQINGRAKKK